MKGEFVAVRGEEVLGPFDSYEDTLKNGYDRFGVVAFLVKK